VVAGLLALAVLMTGLNIGGWRDRLLGRPRPGLIKSLAVLPLENRSHDPEQDYFADGMTDELITELAGLNAVRVISRTSVMRFKNTDKSLPEIARALNVDAVVEGSVQGPRDRRHGIRRFNTRTSLADRIGRNLQNKLHRRLIEIVLRKCGREIDEAPNQNQQFRRQCFHSARRCDSHDFLSAATPDFLARLLTARGLQRSVAPRRHRRYQLAP